MVRFYWRRDISKKTKIMRKVKFPFELDVLDIVTDDLKTRIRPVNERFKEVDKDRRERAKVRRRAKIVADQSAPTVPPPAETVASSNPSDDPPEQMAVDAPAAPVAGELVDEPTKRKEEIDALNALVDAQLKNDEGANVTALYELAGIVTHKGASADGDEFCSRRPLLVHMLTIVWLRDSTTLRWLVRRERELRQCDARPHGPGQARVVEV